MPGPLPRPGKARQGEKRGPRRARRKNADEKDLEGPGSRLRVWNIIATFILGLLAWGVLSMLIVGIREHRD